MNIDWANPLPSLLAVIVTTLMAVIGIVGGKVLFSKVYVPGLAELFAAA